MLIITALNLSLFRTQSDRLVAVDDVMRLRPLLAFINVEFDLLSLAEGPAAFARADRRIVDEDLARCRAAAAFVALDKSKTLGVVEPLHLARSHIRWVSLGHIPCALIFPDCERR